MSDEVPSFSKRGPAPLARLCFYVTLSLALIIVDTRFRALEYLRNGVFLITYPLQQLALAPASLYKSVSVYFSGLTRIQEENAQLKRAKLENEIQLLRVRQIEIENERLRKLLDMKILKKTSGQVARVLYAARDPFFRRLIVDKGQLDGISQGRAVIDYDGVVGQVTRVFQHASEITLITDKNHAIPVQVLRNGLRSVLFGLGNGQLELRLMPVNADIQNGDQLVTSGLDGVFPAGMPVARVARVDNDASYVFARIYCLPQAGIENFGELMILDPDAPVALPKELAGAKPVSPIDRSRRKRLVKE